MGFAFAPDGQTALVLNDGDGTVTVIDLKAKAVRSSFKAGQASNAQLPPESPRKPEAQRGRHADIDAHAPGRRVDAATCDSLRMLSTPQVTVTAAETVPAGVFVPPPAPAPDEVRRPPPPPPRRAPSPSRSTVASN